MMTKTEAKTISQALNTMLSAEIMMRSCLESAPFDQAKHALWSQEHALACDTLRNAGLTLAGR